MQRLIGIPLALALFLATRSSSEATVPHVIGLPLPAAIEVADSSGFEVQGTGVYERDPQEPTAIVVAQERFSGSCTPNSATRFPARPRLSSGWR